MAKDFGHVTVTPPTAPVRDARRLREFLVKMNLEEIPAVLDGEGAEVTPAIPAGEKMIGIEVRFTNFSSTDEKHPIKNPGGVVSTGGTNSYKGVNVDSIKTAVFKAGTKAEIEARMAEDNIDE